MNCDGLAHPDAHDRLVWVGEELESIAAVDFVLQEDLLWNNVRVDNLGRRWVVLDFDLDELQNKSDVYDIAVADIYSDDVQFSDVESSLTEEFLEEIESDGIDLSWDTAWCDETADDGDVKLYNGEDRNLITINEWNDGNASKALLSTVLIYMNAGSNSDPNWVPICSGSYIDSTNILTAAHCVWENGSQLSTNKLAFCTRGNYNPYSDCSVSVTTITVAPSYNGGSIFSNDYALLHVTRSNGSNFLNISNHSGNQLENLSIRHIGSSLWPQVDEENLLCTPGNRPAVNRINGNDVNALHSIFDIGDLLHLDSNTIGAGIDAAAGQSGGPLYVLEGNTFTHVGVVKGFHILPSYVGGPRTSNIRSWIIANL